MKRLIILSTIYITLFSCSINKKPEFINIENIKVLESTSKHITFTANALFINPNDVGGELKTDEIKVYVNNNEMATISTENFKVPTKKEFFIPLKANIPIDSIFSDNSLSALLGSIFNKKLKVQYKGDIKYKILGFTHTYSIDKTENIKIKL
ncbi:hypothetical protein A8C32_06105 [Flavivirga aquatica]|uniref:Uncharacterized protein n=1 Tax=Flavivirga aquatica TaxID=1849968 RepID=A0A1E5SI03_9FLAO|nr:LEA type 2 family protein [Flavivirga aquatica]OEJ98767.1 hypothetical protein A8C32_06105 [Flavivirga aquatica]